MKLNKLFFVLLLLLSCGSDSKTLLLEWEFANQPNILDLKPTNKCYQNGCYQRGIANLTFASGKKTQVKFNQFVVLYGEKDEKIETISFFINTKRSDIKKKIETYIQELKFFRSNFDMLKFNSPEGQFIGEFDNFELVIKWRESYSQQGKDDVGLVVSFNFLFR